MENLKLALVDLGATAGGKLLYALLILVVGRLIIKRFLRFLRKWEALNRLDSTVRSFTYSLTQTILYTILAVSVVATLGVPMASITAVIASAGLALGLALQGALSNFAGGIMILLFKPYGVGDYIAAGGGEGTVRDISTFYTELVTIDNKRLIIPNGTLMNANITNYSAEPLRRLDITFQSPAGTPIGRVKETLSSVAKAHVLVLADPAPTVVFTGQNEGIMSFSLRVWCNNKDYWTLHFDLNEQCLEALVKVGVDTPVKRMTVHVEQ